MPRLQQYLPLAVLKLDTIDQLLIIIRIHVATVLTACGIETGSNSVTSGQGSIVVATVLTACGIETYHNHEWFCSTYGMPLQQYLPLAVLKQEYLDELADQFGEVATVLTACGIETYYPTG